MFRDEEIRRKQQGGLERRGLFVSPFIRFVSSFNPHIFKYYSVPETVLGTGGIGYEHDRPSPCFREYTC